MESGLSMKKVVIAIMAALLFMPATGVGMQEADAQEPALQQPVVTKPLIEKETSYPPERRPGSLVDGQCKIGDLYWTYGYQGKKEICIKCNWKNGFKFDYYDGQPACVRCTDGEYGRFKKQDMCIKCPPGFSLNTDLQQCAKCPSGFKLDKVKGKVTCVK